MNSKERRIEKLEKIFFPNQTDHGFLWPEFQLYVDFLKTFPDPDTAPAHLRRPYLLLHGRWLRGEEIRKQR
jgi:hypothetical protein